jgi:hypothetical protein
MVMSLSSAAFFAENFAGTVSVFAGAPGTAKAPLTNTAFAGGLAFQWWLLLGGGRSAEDTEVIDFFAPPREDFLLGGKPG